MKIEPNKTNKSKLALALKRRFGSPSALLRALGLDESLVDVGNTAQPDDAGTKQRVVDFKVRLQRWLHDQAAALPEDDDGGLMAKLLALIDVGGEDQGPDPIDEFRKLMRGKLSEEDLATAIEIARSGGDADAKDRLPNPATKGGFGGYGNGVKVAADERRRASAEADLDRMLGELGLDAGGFSRITLGLDYGGLARPRPVTPTPTTTARQIADFNAMFKNAARIG